MIDKKIYEKRGELESLKEERQALRYAVDVIAKGVFLVFDPMDVECTYADKVDKKRLQIYTNDICKKVTELEELNIRIKQLERELGANA